MTYFNVECYLTRPVRTTIIEAGDDDEAKAATINWARNYDTDRLLERPLNEWEAITCVSMHSPIALVFRLPIVGILLRVEQIIS